MPADMVSFAVSTGLGVSVVAGILSGVCYVLVYGASSITRNKSNRKNKTHHCGVCGEYFRSIDHILEDSAVTCVKCHEKVCQKRCAKEQPNGWTCKNCLRPPESWFQGIMSAIQIKKTENDEHKKESNKMTSTDKNNKIDAKEEVRDFLEKLVSSMLGQNIDDASVARLYNDENYLPLIGQQSPCTAHTALKHLIEKLLLEVLDMPALKISQENAAVPPDLQNKTYEDLLATAILNKAISNSQRTRPTSSAASISSRLSTSSHTKEDKEYFFGEETLDNKWKHADFETTSISSLDDWLQTDSSFGSTKYVDKVTLTIKQDIEELSQNSDSDENDEDNDSEYFKSKSSVWSDDEPNWFLQKRHFQNGAHSPVPVPMLVPNPTTEAKVLIGDKEVDETSDLSDVESEFGETEVIPTRHSLLLNSKTLIGGKNLLQNGVEEEDSEGESADSGVKEVDREQSIVDESENSENDSLAKSNDKLFRSRADIHIDDDNVEDTSLLSVYSHTEQEAEYTEQYASLPRKIEKEPQPPARTSLQKVDAVDTKMEPDGQCEKMKEDTESDEEVKMVQMHFSGSYSTREKEKWKNAIEMKNNPYSKENIEKRIKRSNSGAGSLFGPDYYARLASSPSGTKSKSEAKNLSWPPPQVEEIEDTKEETDKNTYKVTEEETEIFRAEPVFFEVQNDVLSIEEPPKYPIETHPLINQKSDNNTNSIMEKEGETSIEYQAEVTSDSDLSYINCYDVGNSQIIKKTTENNPKVNGFVKNTKSSTRTIKKTEPASTLKRYKSESDLYDDYDTPTRILPKKKDNTLISKIYKVLSKENLFDTPTFRTQLSSPDYGNDHYSPSYGSLSSSSLEVSNNTMTITKNMSLSSEDEFSDQNSFYSEYKPIQKYFGSKEDLLSIDETEKTKKKDNTIISKIYQQPNVRNYAMSKRQVSPTKTTPTPIQETPKIPETKELPRKNIEKSFTDAKNEKNDDNVNEVTELAKMRIVHNILDKFNPDNSQNSKVVEHALNEDQEIHTSVKDLMKKFENNVSKNQVVSSLTARSLSRHVRKPLRN